MSTLGYATAGGQFSQAKPHHRWGYRRARWSSRRRCNRFLITARPAAEQGARGVCDPRSIQSPQARGATPRYARGQAGGDDPGCAGGVAAGRLLQEALLDRRRRGPAERRNHCCPPWRDPIDRMHRSPVRAWTLLPARRRWSTNCGPGRAYLPWGEFSAHGGACRSCSGLASPLPARRAWRVPSALLRLWHQQAGLQIGAQAAQLTVAGTINGGEQAVVALAAPRVLHLCGRHRWSSFAQAPNGSSWAQATMSSPEPGPRVS